MLYSNRAAAKSGSKDYQGALEDAEKVCLYVSFRASRSSCGWFEDKEESSTFNALAVAFGIALHSGSPRMGVAGPNTEHTDIQCIEIAPTFAKGFARKGAALHGLRSYPEAVMAYESGLQVDEADAACRKGLTEVKAAMDSSSGSDNPFGPGGDMGMGKIFNDPSLIPRLQAHPKTMAWMRDPAFVQKVRDMGAGKADMGSMLSDPRMLSVMGVAMGVDIVSCANLGSVGLDNNDRACLWYS